MARSAAHSGEDLGLRITELIQELRHANEQLLAEIADRRHAEEALRRSEETIRALLNAPADTALLIDTEGTVLAANETAIRRLRARSGRHGADLVGRNVYDLFPEGTSRLRKARNAAVIRSGRPARYVEERDGRWFDHSIYPVLGDGATVTGLAIFSRDITETKKAEEALRQSRETIHALLNAPTDAALLIDTEGAIQALNETAVLRLAAHSGQAAPGPDSLLGRCVYDLFPPQLAQQRKSRNETVVRTGKPARYEDERGGDWFDNSIYPVFDANGEVAALAVFTRDITDIKRAEEALRRMAFHDPLTGLHNRAAFESRFDAALREAEQASRGLAVICLDLDHFKQINDTLGHFAGDRLLQDVGKRLASLTREGDTVARLGGDEFVLILPGVDRVKTASEVARRIIRALAAPFHLEGRAIKTSTAIGISFYPAHGRDRDSLVRTADAAMYRAKQRGRGRYHICVAPSEP